MKGFIRLTLILVILVALWQWLQDELYERDVNERWRIRKESIKQSAAPGLDLEAYDDE